MAARRKRSKKASGASSISKPRPDCTLFVDQCLGRKIVPQALRALGLRVETKGDHFELTTDDAVWLKEVGLRGWLVLSKDQHIRYNDVELGALLRGRARAFLLTSGNCSGTDMAKAFCRAARDIVRLGTTMPAPFIATVSKEGRVRILLTASAIMTRAFRTLPE